MTRPHFLVCPRSILGAFALLISACGAEPSPSEQALGQSQQALSSRADVLGFETQAAWSSPSASLTLNAAHTQGSRSLEVTTSGWNEMVSAQLSSIATEPVRSISYDVRVPAAPANPWWFGETQLYVTLPSQGIYNRYLGRFDLAGAQAGQFTTVTYAVPDEVAQKLATSYSDLRFSIVLNTPSGSQSHLLDNLRFNGKSGGSSSLADCPNFLRVLSNGDVVAELITTGRRSLVELVVRRNYVETTSLITSSEVQLENGRYTYSATLPRSSHQLGDAVSVRFRSRASGSATDLFSPGPDGSKFSGTLSYDPGHACMPVSDLDGDGARDSVDGCPNDPDKKAPGACGCGYSDSGDADADSVLDCLDKCPTDPKKSELGDCGCAGAYAAAGTACTDGPCPGKSVCDGQGKCGNPLSCAIPGTVGLPQVSRIDDSVFWLQPNAIVTWQQSGNMAPPGYSRVGIDDAQEVTTLAAQIKKYYGSSACVWTSGTVTAPGVISAVPRNGAAPRPIWDQSARPPNLDNAYLPFAPGQPPAGVTSGCVALGPDGLLRVESCSKSCAMVYERSALSLVSKVNPADFRVGCGDLPGIVCDPLDGYDKAAEADCEPESTLPAPGSPAADAEAQRIEACKDCQRQVPQVDCSSQCQGMAGPPGAGRICDTDRSPQVCRVTVPGLPLAAPNPARDTCSTHAECTAAGQVCGVYSYVAPAAGQSEVTDYWQTAAACTPADIEAPPGSRPRCRTVRVCGVPDVSCDTNLPPPDGEPCPGCVCREPKLCVMPNPVGDPDPTQQQQSKLGSEEFVPASTFQTVPEPPPSRFPEDEPPANPTPENHPWCKFAPQPPPAQLAETDKHGEAGNGSFVQLTFDPNLDLSYELEPLAQGDLDFTLRAAASFSASASFDLKGKKGSFDIVNAEIGALAERCRLQTQAKLDLFGIDFIPLISDPDLSQLRRQLPADATRCESAIQAFQEVASRAKKAMRDAQELLTQYHDALARGECFDTIAICDDLMQKAPPGFPKLVCDANVRFEDIANTFNWYYERQIVGRLPLPDALKRPELHFDIANARAADLRLPNPRFDASLPAIPALPDLAVSALPDLEGAQVALAELAPRQGVNVSGAGCTGDKVKTERQTLMTVNFALGPVPMVLEVEGVVKYGVNYDVDFAFEPQNLITSSSARAKVAEVKAVAEPCASAGVGLFVGAGFSMGGFKAAAGVEGMVNLATISMPAHAAASIQAAREQVSVLDPLEQLPGQDATGPVRYVADGLRGLWDGKVFPLYRQKIYLGYDYGARVEATEILKGKLSATVAVKFFWFKKKWRTTLVNFGSEDHGFKRTLIHGDGEFDVATGPFPWTTLEMPDAFVRFRPLNFMPPEFLGRRFSDLHEALRDYQEGDFAWPSITLPMLSRLGLDLPDLGQLSIPNAQLPELAGLLGLSIDQLRLRFEEKQLPFSNLSFADFATAGFNLVDFQGWQVPDQHLLALDLNLSQMVKLGFDLSNLDSQKLNLPLPSMACDRDLDLRRVGDFFFDNYCPSTAPPTALDELIAMPDRNQLGAATLEHDVVAKFPGRIEKQSLKVLIESGNFDDYGDAVLGSQSIRVSSTSTCQVSIGQANGANVAPLTTVSFDANQNETTVAFKLRATDTCGVNVGWTGLKVRYQTSN
jgi:hypothetical protein